MNETTDTQSMSKSQVLAAELVVVVVITAVSAITFIAVQATGTLICNKIENRRYKKAQSKKH